MVLKLKWAIHLDDKRLIPATSQTVRNPRYRIISDATYEMLKRGELTPDELVAKIIAGTGPDEISSMREKLRTANVREETITGEDVERAEAERNAVVPT